MSIDATEIKRIAEMSPDSGHERQGSYKNTAIELAKILVKHQPFEITDCVFKGRGDDTLIVNSIDGVKRMIRYAVIPMEEYSPEPASVQPTAEKFNRSVGVCDYCHEHPCVCKAAEQPDGLSPEFFNSHVDRRLTKSGGMGFDLWFYILELETKAHDFPTGKAKAGGWRDYYENDYTPHLAIEEDFNYGN